MRTISLLVLTLFFSIFIIINDSHAQLRCDIKQLTFNDQEPSERNSIAADGSIMAFTSEDDLIGQNPNFVTQIFYYDILNETFTQVTTADSNTNSSFFPSVSGDGNIISFHTFFPGPNS